MNKTLRSLVGGLALSVALAGCGDRSNRNNYVLSNGMEVPKDKVTVSKFRDEKEGKEVTAYYFFDNMKTDLGQVRGFLEPPAVYDFGDGKPFRFLRDNPIPKLIRIPVDESYIERLSNPRSD